MQDVTGAQLLTGDLVTDTSGGLFQIVETSPLAQREMTATAIKATVARGAVRASETTVTMHLPWVLKLTPAQATTTDNRTRRRLWQVAFARSPLSTRVHETIAQRRATMRTLRTQHGVVDPA